VAADDELVELRAQNALLLEQNALLLEQNALLGEQHALLGEESALLRKENAVLGELVEELERRVDRDSRNSSQPPSQDPPKSRAERRREARAKLKELSRRKPGGQPGHEGKHREMVASERVDRRSRHLPDACSCGHRFDGSEERVDDPVIHQQWELPPIRPLVFEYELLRLRRPCCGRPRLADQDRALTTTPRAGRGVEMSA